MTSSSSSFNIRLRRARRAVALCAVLALAAALALPSGAQAGSWKPQGPGPAVEGQIENVVPDDEVTGAIHTVLAHPTNPKTLWVGTVNGGVWRTRNADDLRPKWKDLTDTMPTSAIGALEFDFVDPTHNTLWASVGRWSSFGRLGGNRVGLYRSVDSGNNWTLINGSGILTGKNISGVAARGTTIVIAVDTADAFTFGNIGIWRSTDGGTTFTQIATGNGAASGLPGGVTHDLVGDRANPTRLFTSVLFANLVGGVNGFYRSTNTGANWTKVSDAAIDALLISGTTNNVEFAVGRHNNVYAAISNAGRLAGLLRSADGGTTWTAMDRPRTGPNNVGIHPGAQGSLHLSIVADPTDANIVYIGGDRQPFTLEEGLPFPPQFPNSIGAENFSGRLFRCNASLAVGSQCTPLTHIGTASNSSPHADSREMMFDAAGNLIQTDDGGIYKRTSPRDATGDWFSLNGTLQVTEEHDLSYDTFADIAFVGTQDNDDPHQASPGSAVSFVLLSGDGGDTAVDTKTEAPDFSTRYDSAQGLQAFVRTSWTAANELDHFIFPPRTLINGPPPFIGQFTTPVELNAIDPLRIIFGGANGVYETFNQGDTIKRITPACGAAPLPPCTIVINGSGVEPVSYGGVGNPDLLVIGVGDRVFVRTAADPAPLTQVASYPGTGTGRTVRDIVIHPANASAIYLTNLTQVFQTLDGGTTWTNVSGNIQTFQPIALRAIAYAERPGATDLLFVSTFNGLYMARETTGFTTWEPLGTGLPNVPILDLHYDAEDRLLTAGTLGRGTWQHKIGDDL